jgi:hypothetical protein
LGEAEFTHLLGELAGVGALQHLAHDIAVGYLSKYAPID